MALSTTSRGRASLGCSSQLAARARGTTVGRRHGPSARVPAPLSGTIRLRQAGNDEGLFSVAQREASAVRRCCAPCGCAPGTTARNRTPEIEPASGPSPSGDVLTKLPICRVETGRRRRPPIGGGRCELRGERQRAGVRRGGRGVGCGHVHTETHIRVVSVISQTLSTRSRQSTPPSAS